MHEGLSGAERRWTTDALKLNKHQLAKRIPARLNLIEIKISARYLLDVVFANEEHLAA